MIDRPAGDASLTLISKAWDPVTGNLSRLALRELASLGRSARRREVELVTGDRDHVND